MSSPNQARRARIRDQMRDFYQFEGGASPHHRPERHANAAPGPAEMDLDSETFDVQKFTTQLLQRESLKGLVEADTELLRKVRSLDGELQDLVYKNYSKFISATDTIRQMKENVSDMDSKLKALSSNVSNIDAVSRVITDNLQSHRSKLEEMLVVNKMLRKVHFLIELPERMNAFVDAKKYHLAVRYWVAGDNVFSKHTSISTFEKTHDECSKTARRLYAELERAVMSVSIMDADSAGAARKLVEDMRLMRTTSIFNNTDTTNDDQGFYQELLTSLLSVCKREFDASLNEAKESLAALRLGQSTVSLPLLQMDDAAQQLFSSLRSFSQNLKLIFATLCSSCERCFDLVSQLEDTAGMEALQTHLRQIGLPAFLDVSSWVLQSMEGIVGDTTRCVLRAAFDDNAAEQAKHSAQTVLTMIARSLKAICQALRAIGTSWEGQYTPSTAIDEHAHKAIRAMVSVCEEEVEVNRAPHGLLLDALVCRLAPHLIVDDVMHALSIDVTGVKNNLALCLKHSLQSYVATLGNLCNTTYRIGSKLPSNTAVAAPSDAIRLLVENIRTYDTVHGLWFSDDALAHQRTMSTLSQGSATDVPVATTNGAGSTARRSAVGGVAAVPLTRKEQHTLYSDVDRALSKASAVLTTAPRDDRLSMTEALMTFVIKCLVEAVRAVPSCSTAHLHTVQMDATYLLMCVARMKQAGTIKRDAVLVATIGEWAACASERAAPNEPLSARDVEAAVEASAPEW